MTTCGLILAAGPGRRFAGGPKQLADLGGRPLLEWAISAHCSVAGLERVVVVLGASASEILDAVHFARAEPVVCGRWEQGRSASLRTGMRMLADSDRVIVTLGDQPLIGADVISRFTAEPPGTRAVYEGRPGHPVVLGPEHVKPIQALRGDCGAHPLLAGANTIECGALAPGGGVDVDTVEQLNAMRKSLRLLRGT